MSRTKKINKNNLEEKIIKMIDTGQIKMKPRWYFLLGSFLTDLGLVGSTTITIFLINFMLFLVRKKGPGIVRVQLILENFPWWLPILTFISIILGIWLLRKYEFSYKKNFIAIVLVILASIFLSAWIIDYLRINDVLFERGPIRKFYQQFERRDKNLPHYRQPKRRYLQRNYNL